MVKKTTLLERLKSRFRSSAVRVDADPSRSTQPKRAKQPEQAPRVPEPPPQPIAELQAERVSGRKLSGQEQAVVSIQDGFRELSSLLRGMDARVEDHGEKLLRTADQLAQLPALSQSQIELMRLVAERLETQNQQSAQLAKSLGDLPQMIGGVREALDRAAATDARSLETLTMFRSNMDRIHDAMAKMVDTSEQQAITTAQVAERTTEFGRAQVDAVRELARGRTVDPKEIVDPITKEQRRHTEVVREMADSLTTGQAESGKELKRVTSDGLRSLRDAQADQATRIGKLVGDNVRVNRGVLVLLVLMTAGLIALGAALLAQ